MTRGIWMGPRPRPRRLVASLLALTAGLALGGVAHATTLADLTVDQMTDASTYIVEGKVLDVWTEIDPDRGLVWTKARVEITDTLKGPDRPEQLVVSSLGGEYGDYEVYIPAQAVFSPEEDVFLFLGEQGDKLSPISMFEGKYTIRRAPGETRSYVRTWHTSRGERFDARFLPHPAATDRVYLDDLRAQVEDQLARGWDGKPIPTITAQHLAEINTPERRKP